MFYPDSLDPDGNHAYDIIDGNPSGESLGGWAPGDQVLRRMILRNEGTLDAKLTGIKATPRETYTQTLKPINRGGSGGTRTVTGITSGDAYQEFIEKANVTVTNSDNTIVIYEGTLSDLIFSEEDMYADVVNELVIQAEGILNITFDVTLDVSAGNDVQGQNFIFDFGFYSEQVRNNDTAPVQSGTINGGVVNALTGDYVSGISINFGNEGTTTTDSDGLFTMTLPEGTYNAVVSGSGYVTSTYTVEVVGGETNTVPDFAISPTLSEGETRIVLTWGANPTDLDSHLTGPLSNGDRFHVSYSNTSVTDNGVLRAALDRDDTNSYGPETITISNQIDGVYRYSVYNYSGSPELSTSDAQVKVYRGDALVATFDVPDQEGRTWTVFELEGDQITPINEMPGTFGIQSAGSSDLSLIENLPRK
jgi:uncharacterized protein YfaP (DUF2135 family)